MKNLGELQDIKNIGSKTLEKINKLNIYTIQDLLTYFPRDYEDRREILNISDLKENEVCSFKAYISSVPINIRYGKKVLTKVKVSDGINEVDITWFNQPYLKSQLRIDDEYIFVGMVNKKYSKIQLTSPKYEKIKNKESLIAGRIVPKYSLTYKVSQNLIKKIVKSALDYVGDLKEYMPLDILKKYKLKDINYAIHNIHFPENDEAYLKAKKRLVFEEFFYTQYALRYLRNKIRNEYYGIYFSKVDQIDLLKKDLPFKLTNAQNKVIEEIKEDMKSKYAMNRLVQGDVGSGKTVVALLAIYISIINGYQAAMMAPTEILAKQHYEFFNKYLSKRDIKVGLLVGSMTLKEKRIMYEKILNQEVDVIIGTHALIQKNVEFNKLGLVVTDEQHRFGVEQRISFNKKAIKPDVLVMTATPIPRTLGLILYGDLDISIIDEMPVGREKVDTYVVNSNYYDRLYKFIEKEIKMGRQAYIVCPLVEENEDSLVGYNGDNNIILKSVVEYTKKLQNEGLKNCKVDYIHGKMKSKDKDIIMEKFNSKKIDVLVATTVIEVGISIDNATIMVIENAERFGLSQLHQLRGRVGRGSLKSYCILVSDSKGKIAKERMEVMKNTSSGFVIAEKDMELRGIGDFFGTKQHGIPEFKIANLYEDREILKDAQKAVDQIINNEIVIRDDEKEKMSEKIDGILKYSVL